MHDDFDDTVMVPSRRLQRPHADVDEDTIVPERTPRQEQATERAAAQEQAAPPTLIEPTATSRRRVPLTHKRLSETLRAPSAARESGVLPPPVAPAQRAAPRPASGQPGVAQPRTIAAEPGGARPTVRPAQAAAPPVAPASTAHGFRIGDRAPVTLDVPALVGRRPTAPRIPGRVFPRLVRVSSPLSEVSSTHVELRQDGNSVIVTDLRSTNGTVVRMPGSRPVKLRQGESLVVRPGTQVDIGDGNVLEILPPPRLAMPPRIPRRSGLVVTAVGTNTAQFAVTVPGKHSVVLSWGAASDIGRRRDHNEDSFLARSPIFAVADGMGGHSSGDVASAAVVNRLAEAISEDFSGQEAIEGALRAATFDIAQAADERQLGVGTTVTGAALTLQAGKPYWNIFNIGDSRVYMFEHNELVQVTVDHSVVQELVDAGIISEQDAESHPDGNIITRAVGFNAEPMPDYWRLPLRAGLRLLLCSDGLNKEVGSERLRLHLAAGLSASETAQALVDAALAAGGRDNVTVVVVDVVECGKPSAVTPQKGGN